MKLWKISPNHIGQSLQSCLTNRSHPKRSLASRMDHPLAVSEFGLWLRRQPAQFFDIMTRDGEEAYPKLVAPDFRAFEGGKAHDRDGFFHILDEARKAGLYAVHDYGRLDRVSMAQHSFDLAYELFGHL